MPAISFPTGRVPRIAFGLACLTMVATPGCQTPNTTATMVAPPATGMIGQPAPYGGWATPPQGAAYPPTASAPPMPAAPVVPTGTPMPGPATQWQSASPTTAPNSWTWSQPPAGQPPSLQQYGQQLQASAGQTQQDLTAQAQQYAGQLQAQPQQWANQTQQTLTAQQQQYAQQLQNAATQYQQQANAQVQQQLQATQQQVTAQMPQYAPPAQPTNSWNPFSTSATTLPPARATPSTAIPRY